MRALINFVTLLVVLGFNVGCTREFTGSEKLRLVIPFNSTNSSMAAGDMMKFAVVNIQVPGRPVPIVKEFDFDNNPIPWGTPIDLEVLDVPSGPGLLIQFMGVFDTAAGAGYLITYGDALVTINTGTNVINLAATPAGTATREGRVAGRYFTSASGGPTGTLISYFKPPNNRPKMSVTKSHMVNGWFDTLVLDNIPMSTEVLESGITIFAGLTIGHPALAPSSSVLQLNSSVYFSKDERNGVVSVRPQVAGSYYLGYFKDINGPTLSSYRACYLNAAQGLSGWYGVYAGQTLSNPLIYSSGPAASAGITVAAGGYAVTSSNFYTNSDCDPSGNDVVFYPNHAAEGHDSFLGIKPPFRTIDPYGFHDAQYVRTTLTMGPPKIKLKWKYLPGAEPGGASPVTGVDVLYKYSANNYGGGGGHDKNCNDYISGEGYAVAGNVTTFMGEYDFTGNGLSGSNYYGYKFALCAYKITNAVKTYIGEVLTSSCVGGCGGDLEHYGWGTDSVTISSPNSADLALAVHYGSVIGVEANSSELYTSLTVTSVSTPQEFNASDLGGEVLLSVVGMGTSGDCGTHNGSAIQVGQKSFGRLLYASPSLIKVAKGTFVDNLSPSYLGVVPTSNNFCFVTATKVAHYRNLTLNSSVTPNLFDYTKGGGIIPLRVMGVLSISGGVTLGGDGFGFGAGTIGTQSASGHRKASDFTHANGNSGGSFTLTGGGGAGPKSQGGRGMDTGSISLIGGLQGQAPLGGGGGMDYPFTIGGGGGGVDGGNGGGAVFVAARHINAGVGAVMSANGAGSLGASYGGGGGGSIVVVAEKVSGSLHLSAHGGDSSSSANSGGAGGGGTISQWFCTAVAPTTTDILSGEGPSAANVGEGAFDGEVSSTLLSSSNNPACYN